LYGFLQKKTCRLGSARLQVGVGDLEELEKVKSLVGFGFVGSKRACFGKERMPVKASFKEGYSLCSGNTLMSRTFNLPWIKSRELTIRSFFL
jgi:hypothetical protein